MTGDPEAALDGVAGEPGRLLTTFLAGLRSHIDASLCSQAKSDQALVVDICKEAAFYEHRIRKGQKPIFHLEAFAAKCAPQPSTVPLSCAPGLLDSDVCGRVRGSDGDDGGCGCRYVDARAVVHVNGAGVLG